MSVTDELETVESRLTKDLLDSGSEKQLTSDSSGDSTSSSSDGSSSDSADESDSQSSIADAESSTVNSVNAPHLRNAQLDDSLVEGNLDVKDSTLNLSTDSFKSADVTLTRKSESELIDLMSPSKIDRSAAGDPKELSPSKLTPAGVAAVPVPALVPNNQIIQPDPAVVQKTVQPPESLEAPIVGIGIEVVTATPAVAAPDQVEGANPSVESGVADAGGSVDAAPGPTTKDVVVSSTSKLEVVTKEEKSRRDKPSKEDKKARKKGTSRSSDEAEPKFSNGALLAKMMAKFMEHTDRSKGSPRRRHRKRKPSKHTKSSKSKKSRKAESLSQSDSQSSVSSPENRAPASSSRIAKIPNDRKYLQQAMARAKHAGLSKVDDVRHEQLTDALRVAGETGFDIHPSMAYRFFDSVTGTQLPHIQTHVATYGTTFGPLTKTTTKMHLTLARDQIRARRSIMGGPEPSNPFAPVWKFNNDLHHTAASAVAPMQTAVNPAPASSSDKQATSASEVASAINFDQLELDPGPSTSSSGLKRKLQPSTSSMVSTSGTTSGGSRDHKNKSKEVKKDKGVKKAKKHHKSRKSE